MKLNVPKKILLSTLCMAIGSSSVALANRWVPGTAAPRAAAEENPTAKDYFRGIIFKYGPLANQVDTIAQHFAAEKFLTSAHYARYVELSEQIMRDLEVRDPSIFSRFQDAAQSGDHIRILEAMDEAGEKLMNYMHEKYPETRPPLINGEEGRCLVFFLGAAVLIVVAVETAHVVHLATQVTEYIGELSVAEGDVLRDKMIDDIALKFARH